MAARQAKENKRQLPRIFTDLQINKSKNLSAAIREIRGLLSIALLAVDEVPAAILLPAFFVGLCAERTLFAVADGPNAVGCDPTLN